MSRAPALERDQAPEEVRALYDMVEKLPGAPRLTGKTLAHSPPALRLFLEVTRAMTTLTLDPRLRELAFVAVSRLNGSAICDSFHSWLGRKAGLTVEQLDGLADPAASPAYREVERLVIGIDACVEPCEPQRTADGERERRDPAEPRRSLKRP